MAVFWDRSELMSAIQMMASFPPKAAGLRGGTVGAAAAATSCSVGLPTGTRDGDLLVLFVNTLSNSAGTVITPPAGFTERLLITYGLTLRKCAVYTKTANDEGESYDVTTSQSNSIILGMVAIKSNDGIATYDSISANEKTTQTTTCSRNSHTVAAKNSVLLFAAFSTDSAQSCSTPSGFTELFDQTIGSVYAVHLAVSYKSGGAGSSGSSTQTLNIAQYNVGVSVAIGP